MIAALLHRTAEVQFRGETIWLRRPTVADLVAAVDQQARGTFMPAWFVHAHVLQGDGLMFRTVEEVMRLDGPAVVELARTIEGFYAEGLDSR